MKAIIVFGNMGAGKTALCSLLKSDLSFDAFCIDNYLSACKGDEYLAKEIMLKDVLNCRKNLIYECTGANKIDKKIMNLLQSRGFTVVRVLLYVSLVTAKKRWQPKRYNPIISTFETSFAYINDKLKNECADLFFDTEKYNLDAINASIKHYLYD